MDRTKTAVVGVGALGKHHLRWLSQIPTSELVGLYDIDRDRAGEYAKQYSVTAFDSVEQLAEKAEAVSVVVPTSHHFEVASILIEQGVHCLIEKPITSSIEQARDLANLAAKRKVVVTVGQIERFNPAVRAFDKLKINPAFIEAHRLSAFDPRGTDVAVVLDLMIHDIDLALKLIGAEVKDIQASAVAVISEQADIANARLTFSNGAVANLTASRISLHAMRKLRIFQKSGYYSLDLAKKQADLYRLANGLDDAAGMRLPLGDSGQELLYSKIADDGKDMLGTELESFLAAVATGSSVVVTVEQATEALRVALEVERIGLESIARMMEAQPT